MSSDRSHNKEYKILDHCIPKIPSKKAFKNAKGNFDPSTRSVDNRVYCEVSVSHDKFSGLSHNMSANSVSYQQMDPHLRHNYSYNSLENRNLIVNVQVMGKKQEIIQDKCKCTHAQQITCPGLSRGYNCECKKDNGSGRYSRRPKNNNYILAYSGDREIQTHRESSQDKEMLNEYRNAQKPKHKKTHSHGRK